MKDVPKPVSQQQFRLAMDGKADKNGGNIVASVWKAILAFTKGDIGLGNVDNTSDANKPVSTAQAAADAAVASAASSDATSKANAAQAAAIAAAAADATTKANTALSSANAYTDAAVAGVSSSVTLTGAVTGSGSGTIATTIATNLALPGNPTTTTQAPGDNSTKVATTAYADAAVAAALTAYIAIVFAGQVGANYVDSSVVSPSVTVIGPYTIS
jgi:hypothetical protein